MARLDCTWGIDEWRMFDSKDPRTNPEAISRVEVEFEDCRVLKRQYSHDTGWLATVNAWPLQNMKVSAGGTPVKYPTHREAIRELERVTMAIEKSSPT